MAVGRTNLGGGGYSVGEYIPITALEPAKIRKRSDSVSVPLSATSLSGVIEMEEKIRFLFFSYQTTPPHNIYKYVDINRSSKGVEVGDLFSYDLYGYGPTTFYKDRINGGAPIGFMVQSSNGLSNAFYFLTDSGELKRRVNLDKKEYVIFADQDHYVTSKYDSVSRLRQKNVSNDAVVKELILDQSVDLNSVFGVARDLINTRKPESYGSYGKRFTFDAYDLLTLNKVFTITHSAPDTNPFPGGYYGSNWNINISCARGRFIEKSKSIWSSTGSGGYTKERSTDILLLQGRTGSTQHIASFRWEFESLTTNYTTQTLKSGIGATPALMYMYTSDKRNSQDSQAYRSTTYITRGNRYARFDSETQSQGEPPAVSPKWRIPLNPALAIDIPNSETTGVFNGTIVRYVNRDIAPSVIGEGQMPSEVDPAFSQLKNAYATKDGEALYLLYYINSNESRILEIDIIPKHKILK